MLDEGNSLNMDTPDGQPPEEKSNRTFLIVGGAMAGLVFLTIICMAVYFLVIAPRMTAQQNAAQQTIEAANAQAVQQLTSTAEAALWTPTTQPTPLSSPTIFITSSPTPVIALNTATLTVTNNPATLAAMQTQLSFQMTSTAIALGTRGVGGSGMPTTGFFDEVGLPSMIILALALLAVIFLARRMRKAPAK